MEKLSDQIWIEKYRPSNLDDLVLDGKYKDVFRKYKSNSSLVPSFIFHSNKPGTGKTSTARILAKEYDCDFIEINSSDERGIDTIREKLTLFARSLAMKDFKKCVFLDEADGLTPAAQDSLRNLMETYSGNCFFILSCNNLNKIIEPIQSRCNIINFERPDTSTVYSRMMKINDLEEIGLSADRVADIVDNFYPDIRSMVSQLQTIKFVADIKSPTHNFEELLQAIETKNLQEMYRLIYGGTIDLSMFNKWVFRQLFESCDSIGFEECKRKSLILAENEKAFYLGINKEIVFISNMLDY